MSPTRFGYAFPAIRGIQASREYFISMCPLRLIPKVFLFDEDELVPEMRAQRTLNKGRIPELARYIVDNPKDYVFSALTASIDAEVRFESTDDADATNRMGVLHVPMDARFIINDGQHRRAAIERALSENPDLADETIAIVFFLDVGLKRCQQMFADLNRHAIRPSRSIGVLYDRRDDRAAIVRLMVLHSEFFKGLVEMERSALSPRSRKLFTLSAIYHATKTLLADSDFKTRDDAAAAARAYWEAVAVNIPEWQKVRKGAMTSGEVRRDFIHSHGVMLQAFGSVGRALFAESRTGLKKRLAPLSNINWSRDNAKLWEGRAMSAGRVHKAGQNVLLSACVIKKALKITLTDEEKMIERSFARGRS